MKKEKKYGSSYGKFCESISKKGITSYRVATDLGISPMLLSDWKNGKSKPKLDTMVMISDYLGTDVKQFVD